MEQLHSLLALVLRQHYNHRPEVMQSAKDIIQNYCDNNTPDYEKTLGTLYQLMSDLPADILLYFLTTVPYPKNQDSKTSSSSVLIELMKQMVCPAFHNSVRPTIIKYLNDGVPPLAPLSNSNLANNLKNKINANRNHHLFTSQTSSSSDDNSQNNYPNVQSVIDDNIKQNKIKFKKGNKSKSRSNIAQKKINQVKPLAIMCATNINKQRNYYFGKYNKQKKDAWNLVKSNKCNTNELAVCYDVIRDTNKKIRWLKMFETGKVPIDIIKDEYGNSDIFCLERHLQNNVSEDILNISSEVTKSIDNFLCKC